MNVETFSRYSVSGFTSFFCKNLKIISQKFHDNRVVALSLTAEAFAHAYVSTSDGELSVQTISSRLLIKYCL